MPWKVHDPREGGIKHMITDLTQSVMDGEIQNGMPHLRKCPGSMKEARVTLMAEIVSHDTAPGKHPVMVRVVCKCCNEVLGQGLWMPT